MCSKRELNSCLNLNDPRNFRILLDISSYPDEFLDFKELIIPSISASVTRIFFYIGDIIWKKSLKNEIAELSLTLSRFKLSVIVKKII